MHTLVLGTFFAVSSNPMTKSILSILSSALLCILLTPMTSFGAGIDNCVKLLASPSQLSLVNAKGLYNHIVNLAEQNPERADAYAKELLAKLVELNAQGELQPAMRLVFNLANERGLLPMEIEDEKKLNALADQAYGMIEASLIARGLTPESKGKPYVSWEELAVLHESLLPDEVPQVSTMAFIKKLEELTVSTLRPGNSSAALVDGVEGFLLRETLAEKAKHDITMITWAVYDDKTGEKTYREFKAAVERGVKVKVMVDGLTAKRPGYNSVLKKMSAAGIEVVYYSQSEVIKKYMGQHRKMFIVDGGETAIIGGMNPGDVYSHMGDKDKWRDTDLMISGPVARDAYNLSAKLWNEQRGELEAMPVFESEVMGPGQEYAMLIDSDPTSVMIPDSNYVANLLAIRGAKEKIKIENAYVILTPSLRKELKAAIDRGVEVEILSNSAESVDEPVISRPIMESLKELSEYGAKIYLKKGATLHSKFMIIDDHLLLIGSYNMHPRGLRFEGEVQVGVWGSHSVHRLVKQFDVDIDEENATAVTDPSQIVLPPDFLNGFPTKIFFDQL